MLDIFNKNYNKYKNNINNILKLWSKKKEKLNN